MKRSLHHYGFTYIELVIALSIVALTLAFAGPSLERYSQTQKVKNTAREIYTNLQLVRMTAIKENQTITVTFDPNQPGLTFTDSTGTKNVLNPLDFSQSSPELNLSSTKNNAFTYMPMGTVGGGGRTIIVGHNDPHAPTKYNVVINVSGGLSFVKQ